MSKTKRKQKRAPSPRKRTRDWPRLAARALGALVLAAAFLLLARYACPFFHGGPATEVAGPSTSVDAGD